MGLRKLFKKLKRKRSGNILVRVGRYKLWANADHTIEQHLTNHKYYSRNLPRIAKYMEHKYPQYAIIDVGANIGDTIALLRSEGVNQQVYLIEGEASYYKLLQKNLPQFDGAEAYQTFLGENNSVKQGGVEAARGTAKLNTRTGQTTEIKKLDDLVNEHAFKNVKLLKIDTDGFDFQILRGSFDFIRNHKPVLFFEYDAVYLVEQGEHGTKTLDDLLALGYNKIIYYDNFGKMLLSTTLSNRQLVEQLYIYMSRNDGAFPYFDVCAFHKNDDALADEVIKEEMEFYRNN